MRIEVHLFLDPRNPQISIYKNNGFGFSQEETYSIINTKKGRPDYSRNYYNEAINKAKALYTTLVKLSSTKLIRESPMVRIPIKEESTELALKTIYDLINSNQNTDVKTTKAQAAQQKPKSEVRHKEIFTPAFRWNYRSRKTRIAAESRVGQLAG